MEAYEVQEPEEETYHEDKWHGVPPAGERATPSRTRYLLEISGVLIVEFIIWGIYRYFTAPIYGPGFNMPFFIGHIIAAPTIHLGPILLYWKYIRKEKLFVKDDLEDGQYKSFNFGPFKMTKKRLMTAVLVGLMGGVIWRIAEMLIGNFSSVVLGGTEFFSITWFDVFSIDRAAGTMDFLTFFMMTFVMFCIVGPVEEFEFRAFTHDQSQRVLPKWAALIFSSVFFGLSHIPIAIFIYMPQYNLTVTDLIFMEISWMAAGATFGALYMWSRNIFAVIVMHGIGNWQLSVFLLRGRGTLEGLTGFSYYLSDLSISIFANGLMIVIFFLIHKYYWEPQRRGEAAFGGRLVRIQQALFSHDTARKNTGLTGGILAAVTVVSLIILFSISAGLGAKSYEKLMPMVTDDDTGGEIDLTTYTTSTSQNMSSDYLDVGSSTAYSYISTTGQIIKKLSIRLTWQDETEKPGRPTIRRYTNQPDSFRVVVSGLNQTVENTAENPVEGQGTINLVFEVNDTMILDSQGGFTITIEVFMEEAGMWSAMALLGWNDPGNAYDLAVESTLLENPDMMNAEEEEVPEDGDTSLFI